MKAPVAAATLLITAVSILAGCGAEDNAADDDVPGVMEMGDVTAMNDPDAPPAYSEPDAMRGTFRILDSAPPGSDGVSGHAWLAQNGGTTVTVELAGLKPGATYMSHLHFQPCDADDGGDHFQFDVGGSELPPNEVHLGLKADARGNARATTTNDRDVGDEAQAIVVHPSELPDNRLVCADL